MFFEIYRICLLVSARNIIVLNRVAGKTDSEGNKRSSRSCKISESVAMDNHRLAVTDSC